METAQETMDRWVTAVLDLIKLTNQGAIEWKRSADPALQDEEYEADLGGGRKAKLKTGPFWAMAESSPWARLGSPADPLSASLKARQFSTLRIYEGRELAVSFPDIAPLTALTKAVQNTVSTNEHGVLADIHALAEKVAVH